MATAFAVRNGGDFCRDCGGRLTRLGDEAFCQNTMTQGSQQEPKDVCQALGRARRLFCELCGARANNLSCLRQEGKWSMKLK